MKIYKFLMLLILTGGLFVSCSNEDLDDNPRKTELPGEEPTGELEIKDFVWKAMNELYLYKSDTPELADDYFATQTELNDWLIGWDTPEELFYDGLVSDQDRFSWIVSDYEVLESQLQATNKSAGFRYGWAYAPNSESKVVAYVIYVSPGGPADMAGLNRGDYITDVNGTSITIDNYGSALFSGDNLDIDVSNVEGGELVPKDNLSITKEVFKEETIPFSKVFTEDGVKIGYLYLSTFLGEFGIDDTILNNVFGDFKSQGIEELIIDLRYNGGGWSEFSSDLGSMVTGQFNDEIFTKQQWNQKYQTYFEQENPERLISRFNEKVDNGDLINSLNLTRVYVIGTGRSYSASESFIIAMEPYIDVVHVGTNTGGKFQGSITLYDSNNLSKTGPNLNDNHKYALQPLVYKFANANGFSDFVNGLVPDVEFEESVYNLGQLGELDEPLLSKTIGVITGNPDRSFISQDEEIWNTGKFPIEDERGFFISNPNKSKELPRLKAPLK